MPRGRPLLSLTLDDDQREQLQAVARSTSLPHGLVLRARMILACAEVLSIRAVAERVGTSPQAPSASGADASSNSGFKACMISSARAVPAATKTRRSPD